MDRTEQIKEKVREYCYKHNLMPVDADYFCKLIEDAYNTGDHDGWVQCERQSNEMRSYVREEIRARGQGDY
jgi:hypothetical protein